MSTYAELVRAILRSNRKDAVVSTMRAYPHLTLGQVIDAQIELMLEELAR